VLACKTTCDLLSLRIFSVFLDYSCETYFTINFLESVSILWVKLHYNAAVPTI